MTVNDLLTSSLQSLARTKGRSLLTRLGIVIGVMSVIMMLSVGEAAQRFILSQISSFGSDVVFIMTGPEVEQSQPDLFIKESLTIKDVKKLQLTPWVSQIAAKLMQNDQVNGNGLDANAQILGTMPDEIIMNDLGVEEGTFFDQSSVDGRARVAVLGYSVANRIFGEESAVGKLIKVNDVSFRVIGVMEKAGTKGFTNVDTQVYMPVTAAMDLYNRDYLTYITVKTTLPLNEAKDRLRILIRERHNIDNPEDDRIKDDFHLQTQEDLIESTSTITDILQILLISIAAISLVVGGIGIMNIMYVSVTERIKEIGLRKSLGAKRGDVLSQFLVEAIMQTMAGGAIGIALGTAFTWIGIQIIGQFQTGWSFEPSMNGILIGFGVSAAIGIVFGYFPARRAASLTPIEAMRTE
jgi:putative ABC transport system permease protein